MHFPFSSSVEFPTVPRSQSKIRSMCDVLKFLLCSATPVIFSGIPAAI